MCSFNVGICKDLRLKTKGAFRTLNPTTKNKFSFLLFIFLGFSFALWSYGDDDLMNDLMIVDSINRCVNDRLPVTFNQYLQTGYLIMPSGRMACMGELGFGYASIPPYRVWSVRAQPFPNLEITGSYRIFTGIQDDVLSSHGFGDFADKGVNFKYALFTPEDSNYKLPGIAFGMDDILGTRSFKASYVVLTQVLLDYNLELSLGYGNERYRGFFGGGIWFPFRSFDSPYINTLALTAEYDATNYKCPGSEPHPDGRSQSSHINFGLKYRLWKYFDFSVASIRGKEFSWMASAYYNFGETTGFVPKIEDPLPYCAPVNREPLNGLRTENILVQDLMYPMFDHGFELLQCIEEYGLCGERILRLRVYNQCWMDECDVRNQLDALISSLIPDNIDEVIVVIEDGGMPIQEYLYRMDFVRMYADNEIGKYELDILTPLREVTYADPCRSSEIFKQNKEIFCYQLLPKTQTFFGSSTGKFKYALGLSLNFNGYLPNDTYYNVSFGYTFFSNIHNMQSMDRLNPSQLINVRTDYLDYYKIMGLTLDKAFMQKDWNIGKGCFTTLSAGYFDQVYGGIAGEFLYYPINSCWAFGVEGACLARRHLKKMGFSSKIRKLNGFTPTWVNFLGSQYFVDLYYNWDEAMMDFKISAGKFLANDWGVRYEASRNFESGLRLTLWYTHTNGHDVVNGQTYYDKGFSISMPLDIFYTCSCRNRWRYGMSAWLRDVGYRGPTGNRLYETVRDQRI